MCNKVVDPFGESVKVSIRNEHRPLAGSLADKADNPNTTNGAGYAAGFHEQTAIAIPLREQLERKRYRLLRELRMTEIILSELTPEIEKMLRVKEHLKNLENLCGSIY